MTDSLDVDKNRGEGLDPIWAQALSGATTSSYQELIIMPTEKCNFRCTYCYEDFSAGKMSTAVVDSIKKLIAIREEDVEVLHISWFGGEPLLAASIVLDLSSFANKLFSAKNKSFHSSMTTNGYYLNSAMFSDLVAVGVRNYQVSLDGPKNIHDKTRLRVDGSGTFDRIFTNLREISSFLDRHNEIACAITLRIHYDDVTAFELEPLLTELEDICRDSSRFQIVFHEVSRLGGSKDDAIVVATNRAHAHIAKLSNALKALDERRLAPASDAGAPYICYASRPNSLIIRSDGRIGKCTVALNDEKNTIGNLNDNGSMTVNNEKLQLWIRGLFSRNAAELACPLVGIPDL